jgi:hypothetical protein
LYLSAVIAISIIHTYKGKKISYSFFSVNSHLFTEPHPIALQSAIEFLNETIQDPEQKYLFIDEFGKVSYLPPEEE